MARKVAAAATSAHRDDLSANDQWRDDLPANDQWRDDLSELMSTALCAS